MRNSFVDFLNNFLQMQRVKGHVSGFLYRYLNRKVGDDPEVCFLNYGYQPPNGEVLALRDEDEPNRIYIQLYHRVASAVDLAGRDVLEVSCGRGGGAGYVSRYLGPRLYVGLDLAMRAVQFCRMRHAVPCLRFMRANAERLPFADASFDAVINVEASHDYLDLGRFLAEVRRVLRPGGTMLYTDFRKQEDCSAWRRIVLQSGLEIVEEEDITPGVATGLELNSAHNAALVQRLTPRPLKPIFMQFAGVKGSLIHERLTSGRSRYLRFVLRKPA